MNTSWAPGETGGRTDQTDQRGSPLPVMAAGSGAGSARCNNAKTRRRYPHRSGCSMYARYAPARHRRSSKSLRSSISASPHPQQPDASSSSSGSSS